MIEEVSLAVTIDAGENAVMAIDIAATVATPEARENAGMAAKSACSNLIDEHVFLNEERARAVLWRSLEDVDVDWYLDTGASNHMTGDEAAFVELDKGVSDNVKFEDGSLVAIQGRDTVLFARGASGTNQCVSDPAAEEQHCLHRSVGRNRLPDAR